MKRPFGRKVLDAAERSRLPGSFARLPRGFVHYELSGPPRGPVLVLVPGLSVPYSTWERNAPALAGAGYRVLRYDHFGRGYSDRPAGPYDLDSHVEQLAQLVSTLGLARPISLAGLSMGGPVAAAASIRYPGLVESLILVDPLFEWPEPSLRARLLTMPFMGELFMALRGKKILADGQRCDFFEGRSCDEFIPSYLPPLEYPGIERAVLATLRSIPTWPLAEIFAELGNTGLRTLLLWGREDATLPFEQSDRLLALLPSVEFHPVDGAGHVPQWEKAEEVNATLLNYLSKHKAKPL